MLIHHSNRPYEVAAAEASARAKTQLEGIIAAGRGRAAEVIEKVMTEVPDDLIVRGRAITFSPLSDAIMAAIPTPVRVQRVAPATDGDLPPGVAETLARTEANGFADSHTGNVTVQYTIHEHALSQMAYRMGIPWKYVQHLRGEGAWGQQLLAHNLTEHFAHESLKKFLVRSFGHQVRGFLSDRYRRLDSRPLVEAFAVACQEVGAVPVQGFGTDTKVQLKAMIPTIFEPAPHEVVAFYVTWTNSDYGAAAHELSAGILRLFCTNYAVMDTAIRNVHLGKRLSDDIAYSDQTHRLDTAATASAIKDTVKHILGEETTTALCSVIKKAHEEQVDPQKAIARLKDELNKGETKAVVDAFNSPDVEMLPPGQNLWRLSNAISWVAGQTEDTERRMDLEHLAGKALGWALGN